MKRFWTNLTKSTRFQILFYAASLLVGCLLFLGPYLFPSDNAKLFFQGIGIALVSAALLGFAQRLFFYDDFRSEVDSLIGTALDTYLAQNVLPFLKEGFERLFTDRSQAITEFKKHLLLESEHIVIIGSSLKGLLDVTERDKSKKDLADVIRQKLKAGVRVEFLLTHPALAFLREDAEGRKPGAIKEEIIETVRYLTGKDIGGRVLSASIGVPLDSIRLYLGTPTIFAIVCSDWMLVNPYAYQATAYDNFCFEISRKSDQGLYSKIFKSHYKEPWDNKDTTKPIDETRLATLPNIILNDVFPHRLSDLVHTNGSTSQTSPAAG
ncbi:MAG: hypothetical protein U1F71_12500 [Verrucomicrobiaceae bacterium]